MNYQDILRPWAIFRTPKEADEKNVFIDRFRTRGDAYAYLSILRVNNPDANYKVVFDKPVENAKVS